MVTIHTYAYSYTYIYTHIHVHMSAQVSLLAMRIHRLTYIDYDSVDAHHGEQGQESQ